MTDSFGPGHSMKDSILIKRILIRSIAVVVLVSLQVGAATAGPGIAETMPRLIAQYSRLSGVYIPELQPEDIDTLLAGKSIVTALGESGSRPDDGVDEMGLLGLQLVEAPRLLVWLTMLGGGGRSDGRVTSVRLANMPDGSYARYQHVNLPWPIRDRHWVIYCEKNLELARVSDGAIWEHRWSLHKSGEQLLRTAFEDRRIPGLEMSTLDNSIYLPTNRGTWAVIDLGENGSLIVAFYDSDLGGRLPGALVRSISKRQLQKYLEASGRLAGHILENYGGNSPILDGFGSPISREDAVNVARAWGEQ